MGRHIVEWCLRLWQYDKTSTVAPRKHIKTTVMLGYLAWRIYRMELQYEEWDYMSYKEDLGAYHIRRLIRYMKKMPVYDRHISLTRAENHIHMALNGHEFQIRPAGIISFKRGKAPYGIMCDDILKDPETKLSIDVLLKIEKIFKEEVENMPTTELHCWGTPQDDADLFFYLEHNHEFNCKRYPAEQDLRRQKALWPEVWDWERLQAKKSSIGEKAFQKEFNVRPVRSGDMYLNRQKVDILTCSRLKNYRQDDVPKLKEYTYAGLDIGKKTHPSHCAVFGVRWYKGIPHLRQIHSKWMDGWDYIDQLAYCEKIIKNFNIDQLFYDNTRAEFESFRERGELPDCMFPVTFTAKTKFAMASEFDKLITREEIYFLNDERQRRQMLSVDSDLKAIETDEGHGDSFFSICLAVVAFLKGQGVLAWSI